MAPEKWKQIVVYFSQPQSTNIYFNNLYYFASKKCFEQSHCLQVKKLPKRFPPSSLTMSSDLPFQLCQQLYTLPLSVSESAEFRTSVASRLASLLDVVEVQMRWEQRKFDLSPGTPPAWLSLTFLIYQNSIQIYFI